jgi:hypothetical protein
MARRKVFVEGEDPHGRAYFGWQDHNTALFGLRQGYINSANLLVDITLEKGEVGDISALDMNIFPIFFLYRHSIEVSLKNIYYRSYGEIPKGGHDLLVLWDCIHKEVIKNFEDPIFIEMVKGYKHSFIKFLMNDINLRELRNMILEINQMDTKADVFRYLMKTDGVLYFTESKFVDYVNLRDSMNYIYEVLDYIFTITDEYLSS